MSPLEIYATAADIWRLGPHRRRECHKLHYQSESCIYRAWYKFTQSNQLLMHYEANTIDAIFPSYMFRHSRVPSSGNPLLTQVVSSNLSTKILIKTHIKSYNVNIIKQKLRVFEFHFCCLRGSTLFTGRTVGVRNPNSQPTTGRGRNFILHIAEFYNFIVYYILS